MEVEGGRHRAGERPLLFVAPRVDAHDEQANRCTVHHIVPLVFQPVIEPVDHQRLLIEAGFRAEIDVANPGRLARGPRMGPRSDHDALSLARRRAARVLPQAGEVADRAGQQGVVPTGEVERGRLELAVPGLDVECLPVVVVRRVAQHLKIAGCGAADVQRLDLRERHLPQPLGIELTPLRLVQADRAVTIGVRVAFTPPDVDALAEVPRQSVGKIERTALKHHVVAAVI